MFSSDVAAYRRKVEGYKNQLEALECPMDEKMAVCLVLNAFEGHSPLLLSRLEQQLMTGDLTWSRLMETIMAFPAFDP